MVAPLKVRSFVPEKVALPPNVTLLPIVRAVPPAWIVELPMVSVPVPAPALFPNTTVPALIARPPLNVFALLSTSVPAPVLVSFLLAPDWPITPPNASVPVLLKVSVRLFVRVAAPVKVKSSEPEKIALPANEIVFASVCAPPLAWIVATPSESVPVPAALSLPMASVPALSVVVPA